MAGVESVSKGSSVGAAKAGEVKAPAGPQTYVVAVREEFEGPGGAPEPPMWRDLATVTVPPRSKRVTIVKAAFAESGFVVDGPVFVRVLDAVSAVEVPVGTRQPPAELVIG